MSCNYTNHNFKLSLQKQRNWNTVKVHMYYINYTKSASWHLNHTNTIHKLVNTSEKL